MDEQTRMLLTALSSKRLLEKLADREFRDEIGHPLQNSVEFLELLDRAGRNVLQTMIPDVERFNREIIGIVPPETPMDLPPERIDATTRHLEEELIEYCQAISIEDRADALIDLIYVALGRIVEMGLAPVALFQEVHCANMRRVKGDVAKRPGSAGYDAIKPESWEPPNLTRYLMTLTKEELDTIQALREGRALVKPIRPADRVVPERVGPPTPRPDTALAQCHIPGPMALPTAHMPDQVVTGTLEVRFDNALLYDAAESYYGDRIEPEIDGIQDGDDEPDSYDAGYETHHGPLQVDLMFETIDVANDTADARTVKETKGKPMLDLVPYEASCAMADVFEFGMKKYSRNGYKRNTPTYGELVAAMMRHGQKFVAGEDLDDESGLNHVGHMLCCAAMLAWAIKNRPERDDRTWPKRTQPKETTT